MKVSLTPQAQAFVQEKLRDGAYASAEELIDGAILMMQTQDELAGEDLQILRDQIAVGLAQADRGELGPWDPAEIAAEVERRFREERRTA